MVGLLGPIWTSVKGGGEGRRGEEEGETPDLCGLGLVAVISVAVKRLGEKLDWVGVVPAMSAGELVS
jgi:hypothetical protein